MNAPDITEDQKAAYKELLRAAHNGKLGLCSCVEKGTGKPVLVLVAKNEKEDGTFDLAPFGTLFTEDPTEFIEAPAGFSAHKNDGDDEDVIQHSE